MDLRICSVLFDYMHRAFTVQSVNIHSKPECKDFAMKRECFFSTDRRVGIFFSQS